MVKIDKIIKSKRKSLKIEITNLGEVNVYVPITISEERMNEFILSKEKWIEEHRQKILYYIQLNQDIITYKSILILGEKKEIIETNTKKIMYSNDCVYLPHTLDNRKRILKIEKFLKQYANTIIYNRVNYFTNLMQLEPASVDFTNAKTKWGSCDSKDRILLNWRMIMLPPKLIDYIIVHELSHLVELNHSYNFWCVVASVLPQWKESREELKKSNFILHLFRNM